MITLLDGGMGQELLKRSGATPTPLWATQVMMDAPQVVRAVHDAYFAAGAQIATTNTYAVHHDRLIQAGCDERFQILHMSACQMAIQARDAHGAGLVAGAIGPLGWSYTPDLAPAEDEAAPLYGEIAQLHAPFVDLHLLETMSSLQEARSALRGASGTGKPIWLAISVDDSDGSKLRSGEPVADVLALAAEFNTAALLVNCARPEAVTQALQNLQDAPCPLGAYANGFTTITPDYKSSTATVSQLTARQDLDPAAYLAHASDWADLGATIIGGCCEVGPDHIHALSAHFGVSS